MKINSSKILISFTLILSLLCSNSSAITEQEANLFSTQAYEKALKAWENNDIELASMYFINSLSFNPGNIKAISEYVAMIIKQAGEDTSLPADTLDALDNFLNAQVMTVKPDDLPEIIELRSKVSEAHEKILVRNVPIKNDNSNISNAEAKLKQYKNKAASAKTLQEYIENLQSAQNLIEENKFNEPDITNEFQTAQMIDAMIKQINELLSLAEMKSLESLQTYYLQIAETSFQQIMALSVKIPPTLLKELISVKLSIEKSVNSISDKRSEKAFQKIKQNFDRIQIANQMMSGTQQSKINRLNDFIQYSTAIAQEITSEKYNNELKKIMDNVQKGLMNYHLEQEKQYNIWVIKQINQMMHEAEKYDRALVKFKLRDSQNMRNVMDLCLSHIDTRLLNFGAQHCFSRVYEEYYGKLDDTDQKELDKAMAYNAKRALTEF